LPWAREAASPLDTKYPYVCHAEMNAILNKNTASVRGARLYASLFPCNDCCKLILQSGIVEVVYLSDKYHDRFVRVYGSHFGGMPQFVSSCESRASCPRAASP